MLFSGPIPPPMLGAALASAELHLRSDFADLQRGLAERIGLASFIANELGLSFANEDASPIFFVRCGTFESLFPLMQSLLARGMFVCPGGFPAVAKDQSGVRFTLSIHNSEADIRAFLETLVAEMNAHGVPLRPKVPESADRVVAARRVRSSSVPPSRGSACT
jgi:7-keto-8-aminopelargonate synthetase-like enzyme